MDITLYRGTSKFTAELDVDQETGEIMGDFPLDVLVARNPIGTAAFVLNSEAQSDMIDAHIKLMTAKKKALQNNANRATQALKDVMKQTGVLSIKSQDGTFKAVLYKERDKSVDIFDMEQLPVDYMKEIPVSYVPDKTLIKKAISDGFEVPGARIIANDRLIIS